MIVVSVSHRRQRVEGRQRSLTSTMVVARWSFGTIVESEVWIGKAARRRETPFTEAALLVDLAKLPLQVSNQFFDAAHGLGVRRDLPGELAVSQDLHLQFNAFVLRGHGGP